MSTEHGHGLLNIELERALDGRTRRSALLIIGVPGRPIDLIDRNESQHLLEIALQQHNDFVLPLRPSLHLKQAARYSSISDSYRLAR